MSQCGKRGGGVVFQIGGASFLSRGGCPMGGIGFDGGGGFRKKLLDGGSTPHAPLLWETLGGCMIQKNRIGREVGFFNFLFTFLSLFFFYCLQRAYETLKQYLVKFKHSSHELRS